MKRAGKNFLKALYQAAFDEIVDLTVHNGVDISRLYAGAVILDHRIGTKHIGTDLTPPLDFFLVSLDFRKVRHTFLFAFFPQAWILTSASRSRGFEAGNVRFGIARRCPWENA